MRRLRVTNAFLILFVLSYAGSTANASPVPSDDPTTALIKAVEAGETERVAELIRAGGDVQARCCGGHTLLTIAVRGEDVEIVRALIAAGASLKEGGGALWLAALKRNETLVRILLDAGVSPNTPGGNPYRTPLSWAVDGGSMPVMRALIARGADVNAVAGSPKQTTLAFAAERGRLDAVRLLLSAGAHVNRRDADDRTALMEASSKCDFELVEALLDAHADWRPRSRQGYTALSLATEHGCTHVASALTAKGAKDERVKGLALLSAIRTGKLARARSLIRAGADPNVKGEWGATCLGAATARGYEDVVSRLIQRGADVNATDDRRLTPLMWAAATGRPTLASALIAAGADLNAKQEFSGQTALMHALVPEESLKFLLRGVPLPEMEKGRVECATLLISAGADVTVRDKPGATALEMAVGRGFTPVVRELIRAHPDLEEQDGGSALVLAAWRGPLEILEALLDAGASRSELSPGCLYDSVMGNDPGRLRLLIRAGCDPNSRAHTDVVGSGPEASPTLLMLASRAGFTDVVTELIAGGADVNATWTWGGSALIAASKEGHAGIVRILLEHGARVDRQDGDGRGPLRWATLQGHANVVRALLRANPELRTQFLEVCFRPIHVDVVRAFVEAGADLAMRDGTQRTPLMWAVANEAAVDVLLRAGADPNARDQNGKSALMWAIEIGPTSTVPLLIEGGADLNALDAAGQTPLLMAVRRQHHASRLLVDAGANVEIPDNQGVTAVKWAIDHCYREFLEHLWRVRPPVRAVDRGDEVSEHRAP